MMRLSSTRTRRSRLPAEYRSWGAAAGAGVGGSMPLTAFRFRPGIASAPMSSKESINDLLVIVPERLLARFAFRVVDLAQLDLGLGGGPRRRGGSRRQRAALGRHGVQLTGLDRRFLCVGRPHRAQV